jgi:hypothetical protein
VFVVSHTDDVVEHCDRTIEVSRGDDGVSSARSVRGADSERLSGDRDQTAHISGCAIAAKLR